jgi:F0F1-type ATP synthase membrane subunit a
LALSFNLGFLFLGLALHKIRFFLLFVPKGVPLLLAPLIIVIEIVSYLIRTFSLSLRLFANMMAGHTLLKILSSFVVACAGAGGYMIAAGFVPLLLVFAVTALEIGICTFTGLCIYHIVMYLCQRCS